MRAWVYERTSGDEAGTGQDCAAQAVQTKHRAGLAGFEVVGASTDDGISGSVDPLTRPGFMQAMNAVRAGLADLIVLREVSRMDRRHPVLAMLTWDQVRASGFLVVSLGESHFDGRVPADEEDEAAVLLRFVTFWSAWKERRTTARRSQLAMTEIKEGRRKTRSGKPPGRPTKVPDDQALDAWEWVGAGESYNGAAHRLTATRQLGLRDPKALKRARVSRQALVSAWERLGLVVNQNRSETESALVGGAPVALVSVSDTVQEPAGDVARTPEVEKVQEAGA